MNKQPDKLSNSWEINVLESYLGHYAQHFSYDGVKAICKVSKSEEDDCDFNLELVYSHASKEVTFYLQPLEDDEEECRLYPRIASALVADPKSNEIISNAVKNIFAAFDVVNRLKND